MLGRYMDSEFYEFDVLRALESFYPAPNEEVMRALHAFREAVIQAVQALRAFVEAAIQALQAISTVLQPFFEAVSAWWYSLPADVRRAILAASRATNEISHTRHAMRARKIGRLRHALP